MQAHLQERADWYQKGWEANAKPAVHHCTYDTSNTTCHNHRVTCLTPPHKCRPLERPPFWADSHHPMRKLNVRFFHRDRYSLPPQQSEPVLREECCAGRVGAAFYIYSWFQCENQHRTCAVQMGLHYRDGSRESSQDTHCTPLLHKTHVLHGETIIPS